MVFKKVAYRLGFGKNLRARTLDEGFLLTYKTKDNKVATKELVRRAGRIDVLRGAQELNATTAVPLSEGYVLCREDKQIKTIKTN